MSATRRLVGVLAVGASLATGCGSGPTSAPTTTVASAGSTASTPGATAPPDPADQPGAVRVFWTRDCAPPETATDITTCRVAVGAARRVPPDVDGYRAALDALLAGPSDAERAAGLGTNLRKDVRLYDFRLEPDGTAVVDLSRYFETAKTRPQVAQVVFTLTQFPEIKAVRFLIDHEPNGATGVGPQDRGDLTDLTPTILVETPTLGAPLGSVVKVSGTASSPDSKVHYVVRDLAGTDRVSGTLNVVAGPGQRGRFGGTVTIPGEAGPVAVVLAPTPPGPIGAPVPGEVAVGATFTP